MKKSPLPLALWPTPGISIITELIANTLIEQSLLEFGVIFDTTMSNSDTIFTRKLQFIPVDPS